MYTNVGVYVPSTINVQDVQFYSGKLYIICPSDVLYDLVVQWHVICTIKVRIDSCVFEYVLCMFYVFFDYYQTYLIKDTIYMYLLL